MTRALLRLELTSMLAKNAGARVDRVHRRALDGIDEQARKLLRAIEQDERAAGFDSRLSMFAIHGGEPAARDLIRCSEIHRERGKAVMLHKPQSRRAA